MANRPAFPFVAAQTSQLEQPDVSGGGDSVQQFVLWAIAELGLELAADADGGRELIRTEETPKGVSRVTVFRWSADERLDRENGSQAVGDNRLVAWCAEELRAVGLVAHARPAQQPMGVHEISGRLFEAYTVDEGNVHLCGCRLEDRPFLRLSYAVDDRIVHRFFGRDGEPVDERDIADLGLATVVPVGPYPPKIDDQQLTLLISAGRRSAERQCPSGNGNGAAQTSKPLAVVLIWAKHVTGKMQFTIGEATADLPFAGWARTLEAPRFRCEASQSREFPSCGDGRRESRCSRPDRSLCEVWQMCCPVGTGHVQCHRQIGSYRVYGEVPGLRKTGDPRGIRPLRCLSTGG